MNEPCRTYQVISGEHDSKLVLCLQSPQSNVNRMAEQEGSQFIVYLTDNTHIHTHTPGVNKVGANKTNQRVKSIQVYAEKVSMLYLTQNVLRLL